MLARSAQGLYWMGRYLERTDHLCRQLQLQTEALVDRPIEEIYAGWNRIYRSLDRQPPAAGLAFEVSGNIVGADEFTLADSYTLADDLTFERVNPASVWSGFAAGRENARQMRHCISGEMWRALNLAYLRIQQISIVDIWANSPESFYASVSADIDSFMGVAATTMYRGDGWHFVQLGRYIERAQLVGGLLLAQLDMEAADEEYAEADWTTLLRAYHAFEAYHRVYSVEIIPRQALNLLVTDPLLPASIRHALDGVATELAALSDGQDADVSAATRRLAGRASAMLNYEWPDSDNREGLLKLVAESCLELHNLITATYFDFPATGAPAMGAPAMSDPAMSDPAMSDPAR